MLLNIGRAALVLFLVAVAIGATGCFTTTVDSQYEREHRPSRARFISDEVPGTYANLVAVDDTARGVTCYFVHYDGVSCVKVR